MNRKYKHGNTDLFNAVKLDRLGEVEFLLQNGANPNEKLKYHSPVSGETVSDLSVLMLAYSIEVVEMLLSYNADPNAIDSNGESVLMHAVKRANLAIVARLLSFIDRSSIKGDKKLHDAAIASAEKYRDLAKANSSSILANKHKDAEEICRLIDLVLCQS